MAAKKLLTFIDLINYCQEQLGLQSGDTNAKNKIKRAINNWYVNEIVPFKRWMWLRKTSRVIHKTYYAVGTCAVTPDSATVTLSTAVSALVGASGSFTGYKFAVEGFDEIYDISAHTALSTTVTLASTYQGTVSTATTYKIWKDYIALPTDCREVVEMWHNRQQKTMEGKGAQEFRQIVAQAPRALSLPAAFHVDDFFDPSGGAETESDRYRIARLYPAITDQNVTINFDYVQEVDALDADDDEPLLPIEDRIVICYGALSDLWRTIARNPEESSTSLGMYQAKIARMAGKIEEGFDSPTISPKGSYLRNKRTSRIGSSRNFAIGAMGAGSSSYSSPTYLEAVTINGATVTGNITVNSGITIDGRDISVDGATLDAHIADTTDAHDASAISFSPTGTISSSDVQAAISELDSDISALNTAYLTNTVALTSVTLTDNATTTAITIPFASFNALKVDYYASRGSSIFRAGQLMLVTDGTNTSMGESIYAVLGTVGLTLTATISGSDVIIQGACTSTGTNVTFKYKMHRVLV